jgi:hypothetical protein
MAVWFALIGATARPGKHGGMADSSDTDIQTSNDLIQPWVQANV